MRQTLTELKNFKVTYPAGNVAKSIRISDSLQSLNVIGDTKDNGMKDLLIEFNSGQYMTEIEDNCFKDCSKLKETTLLTSVRRIGKNAFKNCTNLSTINLDNATYEYIGDNAFSNTGIKTLVLTLSSIDSFNNNIVNENGLISTIITEYGKSLFSACDKLKTVDFIGNVVPERMFYNCKNLEVAKITLDGSDECDINPDVFLKCNSLSKVILSGNISTIPNFSNLSSLNDVKINSNTTTTIPSLSFKNCEKLTKIEFDSNVTIASILTNAFKKSALKKITFNGIAYADISAYVEKPEKKIEISEWTREQLEFCTDGNFKYGILYANPPCDVLKFGYEHNIPVVIILTGCKLHLNTTNFLFYKLVQDFFKQLPILFCGCGPYFSHVTDSDFYSYGSDRHSIRWYRSHGHRIDDTKLDKEYEIINDGKKPYCDISHAKHLFSVYDPLKKSWNVETNSLLLADTEDALKIDAVGPFNLWIKVTANNKTKKYKYGDITIGELYKTVFKANITDAKYYVGDDRLYSHSIVYAWNNPNTKTYEHYSLEGFKCNSNIAEYLIDPNTGTYRDISTLTTSNDKYWHGTDGKYCIQQNALSDQKLNKRILYPATQSELAMALSVLWQLKFDKIFAGNVRDPLYNAKDYVEDKDVLARHINSKKDEFDFFGIGHDCNIVTSDGVKCKWNEKTKKLTK